MINLLTLALIDDHHEHRDLLVDDLIHKPITAAAQLDLVAVRQGMRRVGYNAWIDQDRSQLLLELLAYDPTTCAIPLMPVHRIGGYRSSSETLTR